MKRGRTCPRMPREIRPRVSAFAKDDGGRTRLRVQAMPLDVAAEAGTRASRARGPTWRLVPARRAPQEHAPMVHLQQRVVAANAAHRARHCTARALQPGLHHDKRLNGADDLRSGLCEIRRHNLRVSPCAQPLHWTSAVTVAFRRNGHSLSVRRAEALPHVSSSYQTACHVRPDTGNCMSGQ